MDSSTGSDSAIRNQTSLVQPKDLATLMIVDQVNRESISDYEDWLTGIHGDLKNQRGFVSVDVIQHLNQPNPEYVILVKFENQQSLNTWRSSPELAVWLSKIEGLVASEPHFEEAIGLELWFDRASSQDRKPAFWKRVVLAIACVYPMIFILGWAFAPITESWPAAVQLFVVVVVLSTLLT
ncbi:MAG: hypothetical protein HKN28_16515 [Alphaproteobacteria bacterium]|nr:hypothetical protein [Alphaproteobacteria bacterium]